MMEQTPVIRKRAWRVGAVVALGLTVAACFPQDPGTPPATTTTTVPGSTTTSTTAAPTTTSTTSTTSTTTSTTTTTTIPAGPACTSPGTGPAFSVAPSTAPDATLTAPAIGAAGFSYTNVDLCWNMAASVGHRTFFLQCKKDPADPFFNFSVDCSNLSEITPNPLATTTGSTSFEAFRGLEPSGDESWGCYAPGDVAPAGVTKYTDCWIRMTQNTEGNNTDQLGVKIHFKN